jgi:16S rRNA processing protein RimM
MACDKHILLGIIKKIHGYEGVVTIRIEKTFSENIPGIESVFLKIDGKPVPFFIDFFEQIDPEIIRLRFEGYDTAEKIKEFVGCKIFITKSSHAEMDSDDLQSLVGYEVVTVDNIPIGKIKEIIKNPGQSLLNISGKSGKIILIPLHEDLVSEVIPDKKIIVMDIPEGITDLN